MHPAAACARSPRCRRRASASSRRKASCFLEVKDLLSKKGTSAAPSVRLRRLRLRTVRMSRNPRQTQVTHGGHGHPLPYRLALPPTLCRSWAGEYEARRAKGCTLWYCPPQPVEVDMHADESMPLYLGSGIAQHPSSKQSTKKDFTNSRRPVMLAVFLT